MDIKHIYIVGAGTMGVGIAQVAATSGYIVTCMDVLPAALEKARGVIEKSTSKLLEKEKITAEQKAATEKINFVKNFSSLPESDLVIEAASENPELKFKIFKELDEQARPGVILATNTSSISITKLAAATTRAEKVIGMHFMNPVPLMKLVEVIRGLGTSDETMEATIAICKKMSKEPVEANDSPGFISNRILCPMINEAIFALQEGIGTPDAIDSVMKLGMNHPMGPLALADLIGLDTCLAIMETLYDGFSDSKYRPCPLLRKYVEAGWLGRKTARGFYEY